MIRAVPSRRKEQRHNALYSPLLCITSNLIRYVILEISDHVPQLRPVHSWFSHLSIQIHGAKMFLIFLGSHLGAIIVVYIGHRPILVLQTRLFDAIIDHISI